MILDNTLKSIEVILGGAHTTNALDVTADYADYNDDEFTPGSNNTTTNGATAVTAVIAPAAGLFRHVKQVRVFNNDTIAQTVTIRLYNSLTNVYAVLEKEEVAVGGLLIYRG
jgi:hypothetical protein